MTLFYRLALCALPVALPVSAEPVQLTARDGTIAIEGELLSHDGELFRIETEHGPVTLDGGGLICSGAGCPDPAELIARARIGGTSDMIHRLLLALLEVDADREGLEALRTFIDDDLVSWELRDPATDRLVADFEARVMEEERAARAVAAGDIDLLFGRKETGPPVRQDLIALDALVPVVAPDNPRAMVTLDQLTGLMRGDVSSWARLGGQDIPVALHTPETWEGEIRRLSGAARLRGATRHADLDALADTVAGDAGALGLVPYSAIGNAVPLVVSGACGLATPATRDTIRAEDYPITHPVFLSRVGAKQPKAVRDFIAFARSPEAQDLIRAAGFVDQAIGRIGFEQQGDRIANAVLAAGSDADDIAEVQAMIATLLNAERLTLTFRFRDGSSELDFPSVSNIQRLADAISRGDFDNHQIIFAGFSDGAGPKDGNLRLSERRARSVRRAVASRVSDAAVDFEVAAFGELMPMACDDTPWGGRVNRRVEIWVKPLEVTR